MPRLKTRKTRKSRRRLSMTVRPRKSLRDGDVLQERQRKRRLTMPKQQQSLSKLHQRSRLMKRSRRANLSRKEEPSPSNRLANLQSDKKSQRRSQLRRRSPKKRRTDQLIQSARSPPSPLTAMRRKLQRQIRRNPPVKRSRRRASHSQGR